MRLALFTAVVIILLAACGAEPDATLATPQTSLTAAPIEEAPADFTPGNPLADLPDEARRATRPGDPRPPAYWAVWNSCAPDNRAAEAAANGGPSAGWFLVDDIIADPGLQLGDYPLPTCEDGLVLLQGATAADGDLVSQLAGQLLAAELNLNIGAESCPIAEETAVGGHIVLSEVGFAGPSQQTASLTDELAEAIPQLIELLVSYNGGDLCR